MMTSKQIQVVDDTPGTYASLNGNTNHAMPVPSDSGSWMPVAYDVLQNNLKVSEVNSRFDSFVGVDKLFSGYSRNDDNVEEAKCFKAYFSETGDKTFVLGARSKNYLIDNQVRARWTSSIGVQMSYYIRQTTGYFKLNRLSLLYLEQGNDKIISLPLYNEGFVGSGRERQGSLSSVLEGSYTQGGFFCYLSDEDQRRVADGKLVTVGMMVEANTLGEGDIDIYDFKLLRTKESLTKSKSLLVVPGHHTIRDRFTKGSIPLL